MEKAVQRVEMPQKSFKYYSPLIKRETEYVEGLFEEHDKDPYQSWRKLPCTQSQQLPPQQPVRLHAQLS